MKHRYTAIADTPLLIRSKKAYLQSSDVSILEKQYSQPTNILLGRTDIQFYLTAGKEEYYDCMYLFDSHLTHFVPAFSCDTRRPSSSPRATTTQTRMLWTSSAIANSLMTLVRSAINDKLID